MVVNCEFFSCVQGKYNYKTITHGTYTPISIILLLYLKTNTVDKHKACSNIHKLKKKISPRHYILLYHAFGKLFSISELVFS